MYWPDIIAAASLVAFAAAIVGALALAVAVGIDEYRYRRDRAAIDHAEAMDALARAAGFEDDPDSPQPETTADAITRHAFDALDGLAADGLEPSQHAPALARRIRTAAGFVPLD